MQTVYQSVLAQLEAHFSLPANHQSLKWIDLDTGQLDNYNTRPPVAFPCALLDISITSTEDLSEKIQHCNCRVRIRLAFDLVGETNAAAPATIRADSLQYFDIVNEVYKCLQGFGTAEISPLSRKSVIPEKRNDGLKVVAVEFTTTFRDYANAEDKNLWG